MADILQRAGLIPASNATTLVGSERIVGSQGGSAVGLTPAQIATYMNTLVVGNVGLRILFTLAADMNSTADQQFTKVGTFTSWLVNGILVIDPSANMTTAAGGIYTAASKGGDAMVANTQVYTALATAVSRQPLTQVNNVSGRRTETPYLSLTTPQGSAATALFLINGFPLS